MKINIIAFRCAVACKTFSLDHCYFPKPSPLSGEMRYGDCCRLHETKNYLLNLASTAARLADVDGALRGDLFARPAHNSADPMSYCRYRRCRLRARALHVRRKCYLLSVRLPVHYLRRKQICEDSVSVRCVCVH